MKQATIYTVTSDSDFRTKYEVQFYADGTARCECPGWLYSSRSPKGCKHVDRLRREGKGFVAPSVTKVFRLTSGEDEVIVVGENSGDAVTRALEALNVRKTFTVERIA